MPQPTAPRPARRWWNPLSIGRAFIVRPKLVLGIAVAAAVGLLAPAAISLPVRWALSWDAGAVVYLSLALLLMRQCDSNNIRARAAVQDNSAAVILALVLLAIMASFAAIFGLVTEADAAAPGGKLGYALLATLTIVVSWFVTQVVFALHYAHEFYAPPLRQADAENGLDFPGDDKPDYWDFLYFATSIGSSSQTSDTAVRSKSMRKLVTLHAIVSFFFNTMVLALTINLATSMV